MSISYPGRTIYPAMGRLNKRPSYNCSSAGTEITVPGSSSSPAVVMIDGKIYENVADVTCDLDTTGAISAGRGSIDTGSIAANIPYYLYGISGVSGLGFDVIASADPPTTGPTGFTSWTYIGACCTESHIARIASFMSSNGTYIATDELSSDDYAAGISTPAIAFIDNCPSTARRGYFQLLTISGAGAAGDFVYITGVDATDDCLAVRVQSDTISSAMQGWCPIITPQTVWAIPSASAGITLQLQGWQEDPAEWK